MQKPRKIPQRMCVGCREKRDKKDLLRVVRTPEGQLVLDATGKKSGRGAVDGQLHILQHLALVQLHVQNRLDGILAGSLADGVVKKAALP